jgi:hypothetical protein
MSVRRASVVVSTALLAVTAAACSSSPSHRQAGAVPSPTSAFTTGPTPSATTPLPSSPTSTTQTTHLNGASPSASKRPLAPPARMQFDPANTSTAFVTPDGSRVVFGALQLVSGQKHWHVIVRNVRTTGSPASISHRPASSRTATLDCRRFRPTACTSCSPPPRRTSTPAADGRPTSATSRPIAPSLSACRRPDRRGPTLPPSASPAMAASSYSSSSATTSGKSGCATWSRARRRSSVRRQRRLRQR